MKYIIEFQDHCNNREYMYIFNIYKIKKREKSHANFFRYSQFSVNNS